jgi:sigma-E factor negative regulatory protein RseA
MKGDVSALVDGELEVHEASATFTALRKDGELRRTWDEYQAIGAVLRKEDRLAATLTARVMNELSRDITIFAPAKPRAVLWHRPLMALAASVAGVAVVGWVAFSAPLAPAPGGSGQVAKSVPLPPVAVVSAKAPTREMQDYLAAHQAHVAGTQVLGGTQHIRTVSAGGGAERR